MNEMKNKWISCTSAVKYVLFSVFIVLKNLTSCEEIGSHVILKRQSIPEMEVEASCEMVCKSLDEDCSFECYLKPVFPISSIPPSPQTPRFFTTKPSVQALSEYTPPKISKPTQAMPTVTKAITTAPTTKKQTVKSKSTATPPITTPTTKVTKAVKTEPTTKKQTVTSKSTATPPITTPTTKVTKAVKTETTTKKQTVKPTSTATPPINTPTTTKPLMFYTPDERITTNDFY